MLGWKLVPIEPAQQQVHAAYKDQPAAMNVGFAQAYRVMVENAPPTPVPPAADPFIWICLVAANTEGDADPDPRIRAWTANGARAAQLIEQGLDMVPVFTSQPTRDDAFAAYRRTMLRIVDDLKARLDKVKAETAAALRARCSAATGGAAIEFGYTNWEGRKGIRQAIPLSIRFGKSEWHDVPQWLMLAYDIDKQAEREYAMADMQFEDGFLPGIDLALNEPQGARK